MTIKHARSSAEDDLPAAPDPRHTSLAFRIRLLPMADRILLHLRTGRGMTCAEVSVVLGKTRGHVCRRVHVLDQRLRSPRAHLLAAMAAGAPTDLTRLEIEIAFARYIAAVSCRRICLALNISRPAMRKHLRRINRHLSDINAL